MNMRRSSAAVTRREGDESWHRTKTRRDPACHVSTTLRHHRYQRFQAPGTEFSPRAGQQRVTGRGALQYGTRRDRQCCRSSGFCPSQLATRTRHANRHRAIGSFLPFLALFTPLPLPNPGQARIVESWGISVQMARCLRWITPVLPKL
jgi:hypothetical protein